MRRIAVSMVMVALAMGATSQAETLRIDGSTTVGPIVDAFAEYFKGIYPGLNITVKQTGSGDGAAALIDGQCDIATMSRFMKTEEEFKKAAQRGVMPVAQAVAMDGVCMVVHPSNPVSALTRAQIQDIFTGKITNWNQLGGPNLLIVAISRETSSGTYEAFRDLIMAKKEVAARVEGVNSNPQAQARVRTTPGAIGYVGIGFMEGVKALRVDGVAPTRQNIINGTYPAARPLFLFTNGYPPIGSMTHKFVTFYLTEKGQALIEAKGFVPFTNY